MPRLVLVLSPSSVARPAGDISPRGSTLWSALGKRVGNGAVTPHGTGSAGPVRLSWSHCRGVCRRLSKEPVPSRAPPGCSSPGPFLTKHLLSRCSIPAKRGIRKPAACQALHWQTAVEGVAGHPSNGSRSPQHTPLPRWQSGATPRRPSWGRRL